MRGFYFASRCAPFIQFIGEVTHLYMCELNMPLYAGGVLPTTLFSDADLLFPFQVGLELTQIDDRVKADLSKRRAISLA